LQEAVYKKVKGSQTPSFPLHNQALSNLTNMFSHPLSFHMSKPETRSELDTLQQMQNFNMMLQMKQIHQKHQQLSQGPSQFDPSSILFHTNPLALKSLLSGNFLNTKNISIKEEPIVKEEFVKQRETSIWETSGLFHSKRSVSDHTCDTKSLHETTSEAFEDKTNENVQIVPYKEPVLVEYTKSFPEWDLATIFSFLRSGQTKSSFEKEKEFRMERKKRRAQKRNALKSKKKTENPGGNNENK